MEMELLMSKLVSEDDLQDVVLGDECLVTVNDLEGQLLTWRPGLDDNVG